jgi:hypothetical protein
MTQTTQTGRGGLGRAVKTDGLGKTTIRHLNQTRSLAYFDEKKVQTKVRKELRLARKEAEAALVAR